MRQSPELNHFTSCSSILVFVSTEANNFFMKQILENQLIVKPSMSWFNQTMPQIN